MPKYKVYVDFNGQYVQRKLVKEVEAPGEKEAREIVGAMMEIATRLAREATSTLFGEGSGDLMKTPELVVTKIEEVVEAPEAQEQIDWDGALEGL